MTKTDIRTASLKKMFVPKRVVFFNPAEGSRAQESGKEAASHGPEKADAQKVSEAAIIYKSNYRNLVHQIDQYAESKNPRIADIAKKYRDTLSANLVDPNTVDALQPQAQQENIKRISAVLTEFSKEVRKASIEGNKRTEEERPRTGETAPGNDVSPMRGVPGVGFPEPPEEQEPLSVTTEKPASAKEKEPAETLEQAYKRYQLVFNANSDVINTWLDEVKTGKLATENRDEAAIRLQQYGQRFNELFGGLTKDMFKDPSGVDRVIAAINVFMDRNADPYYTGLTNKHREIMARRNAEKQSNRPV